MSRRRRLSLVVASGALFMLPLGPQVASAHEHPTPIDRASPGVVFVEARVQVDVSLIEHRPAGDPTGIHIGIYQSTWEPVLAATSGFTVDPTGAVVTSGEITSVDRKRAEVYAINQAFHTQYGVPLPSDPFSQRRISDTADRTEQRLAACYPPYRTNDAGGCVVRVTDKYVVYPYVSSQKTWGALEAERLDGSTDEVAVLRVRGATNMPTVALAASTAGASALAALGFTAAPDAEHGLLSINAHLAEVGASTLKVEGLDAKEQAAAEQLAVALPQGTRGGPVVAETGSAIGFLVPAPAPGGVPRLIGPEPVNKALQDSGVTPRSGPVDVSFENAMHLFKNGSYAASLPSFQKTLELFPGHFLARANTETAKEKIAAGGAAASTARPTQQPAAAGPAAGPSTDGSEQRLLVAGVVGLALVVAVALGLFLTRRRRTGHDSAERPTPARPAPHPSSGSARRGGLPGVAPGSTSAAGSGSGSRATPAPSRPAGPSPDRAPSPQRSARVPSGAAGDAPEHSRMPQARPGAAPDPVSLSTSAMPAQAGQRFCTDCGGRLSLQHRYCGWCGSPVG